MLYCNLFDKQTLENLDSVVYHMLKYVMDFITFSSDTVHIHTVI